MLRYGLKKPVINRVEIVGSVSYYKIGFLYSGWSGNSSAARGSDLISHPGLCGS